jgi:hypothetical protein
MPERTDKYEDLIPHHRRVVTHDEDLIESEKDSEEFSIEDAKEITN